VFDIENVLNTALTNGQKQGWNEKIVQILNENGIVELSDYIRI